MLWDFVVCLQTDLLSLAVAEFLKALNLQMAVSLSFAASGVSQWVTWPLLFLPHQASIPRMLRASVPLTLQSLRSLRPWWRLILGSGSLEPPDATSVFPATSLTCSGVKAVHH